MLTTAKVIAVNVKMTRQFVYGVMFSFLKMDLTAKLKTSSMWIFYPDMEYANNF